MKKGWMAVVAIVVVFTSGFITAKVDGTWAALIGAASGIVGMLLIQWRDYLIGGR